MPVKSYLDDLNPVQLDAVTTTQGPLLILAGAGSGKTRVLTYRVAYLLDVKKVNPREVMAITFTNKAADEMKERILTLTGPEGKKVWISTFHAVCARILRREIHALGYKRNFVVYDDRDSYRLVSDCLKDLNIDSKQYSPSAILNQISLAKSELVDYEEYSEKATTHFEKKAAKVYRRYQERLVGNNALDFDDLIVLTVRLFQIYKEVLKRYQQRFKYILVDEYQDTNHAQYVFVRELADVQRNICVVGDDDQSVYGWRGADVRNILDFEKDFPEARVIRLEQNYRSTKTILQAANEIIKKNRRRKPKTLWTKNDEGEAITLFQGGDEYDEANFVVEEIERLVEDVPDRYSYRDLAVFYRTNAQSRVIEEIFLRYGIPYKIVGGLRFYERQEIKDILAYLRVIVNPMDTVSLKRIINVPRRGIGKKTVEKLELHSMRTGKSFYSVVTGTDEVPNIGKRGKNSLSKFSGIIENLKKEITDVSPPEAINLIAEKSGYLAELEKKGTVEAEGRIEDIRELVSVAASFSELYPGAGVNAFLERISLITDIDMFDKTEDSVTLMTVHNAKGLEFPVVFIVGLEEGLFPHSRSLYDEDELEEERRLCYVGITRAMDKLYLTHAWKRTVWGSRTFTAPSRFLEEIPDDLIREKAKVPGGEEQAAGLKPSVDFKVGDRVNHRHFGEGEIMDVKSGGKIVVDFEKEGEKTLLVEYAPLEKI